MASIGDVTRPAFAYDSATDTWIPVGIGPHTHTASTVGAVATSSFAAKGDLLVGTGAGTLVAQTVGANGTVLTANSAQADGVEWVAPAGGSSWTLITTQAVSGNSTYTVSSLGAYNKLMISSFSINDGLNVRFNSDSGSNYLYAYTNPSLNTNGYPLANVVGDQVSSAGTSEFLCAVGTNSGYLVLDGCKSTGPKVGNSVFGTSGSNSGPYFGGVIYKGTSAISSLTFYSFTGGNWSTGTVRVYGSTN